MNILITGSCGYIGSRLKEKLDNVEECDLKIGKNAKNCLPVFAPNFIYHLAAQSGVPESVDDPINDAEQNIMATLKMIEVANRHKAKLIFTTSGAAKNPESPYGLSKKTCEEYIKMLCDDYVILRFSSIFGDKEKGVVDNFVRDDVCKIFGDGSAIRDFVHVDDIIECLVKAKGWKKGVYECGSGEGVSVAKIAKATGKITECLPARKGDKHEAVLSNSTPSIDKTKHAWYPKINVLVYVKQKCQEGNIKENQ